jgi:hypothetical protein
VPKKGRSEEQIIAALKQYESGEKVADICHKLGVSQASSTPGRSSTRGWAYRNCASCASCGTRIAD